MDLAIGTGTRAPAPGAAKPSIGEGQNAAGHGLTFSDRGATLDGRAIAFADIYGDDSGRFTDAEKGRARGLQQTLENKAFMCLYPAGGLSGSAAHKSAQLTAFFRAYAGYLTDLSPDDRNSERYRGQLPVAQDTLQLLATSRKSDAGAETSTPASEDVLLEALRRARAFVDKLQQDALKRTRRAGGAAVVSLSTTARRFGEAALAPGAENSDLVAEWRNALSDRQKAEQGALGQLQALDKQMRGARHEAALQRLQQLLAQYRALRMAGASGGALADLARQIKSAANELAASGEGEGGGAAASDAAGAGTASAMPVGAAEASAPGAASSPTPDAVSSPVREGNEANEATSSTVSPTVAMWQELSARAAQQGAREAERAYDAMVLDHAKAVIGQINRLARQEEEEKRRKAIGHGRAAPAQPAPVASTVEASAAARAPTRTKIDVKA